MDVWDLARLGYEEFEALCKDLFQEILGLPLEIFGAGGDGGVDLRGTDPGGGTVVVQCKAWPRTRPSRLVEELRTLEVPRVRLLAPARYLLVTSADLTRPTKDRLLAVLAPLGVSATDVYGARDVADALRRRPQVVRRHPRLWFQSADVMATVLHRDLFERNRDLAEDVRRTLRVFVPGRSFGTALGTLRERRVLLVSGLPGVGKTALAHAVAAAYASDGYEVVAVTDDVAEIYRAWDDDRRQLFLWDDFLGEPSARWRPPRSSRALLRAVDRVAETPGKRLVVTTRRYQLAQARRDDEALHQAPLDEWTCDLDLDEYDRAARADVVARHLDEAPLPDGVRDGALAVAPAAVARHRHFHPGTVADVVRLASRGFLPPGDLRDHLTVALDDPARMWGHIVENQLSDAAVDVLAVLFAWAEAVPRPVARTAWAALRRHAGRATDDREFDRAVDVLDRTLVSTVRHHRETEPRLSLHESVRGFVRSYFTSRAETLDGLLATSTRFEQVEGLWEALAPGEDARPDAPAAVRDAMTAAVVRTVDAPAVDSGATPRHRLAAVAEMAAGLGDPALVAFLRERLAGEHVVFEPYCDEEDVTALHILVDSLLRAGGMFDDDLRGLLLPAVREVDPGDRERVYCLNAFTLWFPELPSPIGEEAYGLITRVVDEAVSRWELLDEDDRWLVQRLVSSRSMTVLLPDEPDDPADG